MSAASLTHRLLAFARQQPLDTRPVDINEHVRSLEELLVRTIGERIALKLELTNKPAIALVDPSQLESAMLNLVINARDALPKGGNIWVNTYAAYSHGDPNLADGARSVCRCAMTAPIDHHVIDKSSTLFSHQTLGPGHRTGCRRLWFCPAIGVIAAHSQCRPRGTEVTIMLPATSNPSALSFTRVGRCKGTGEHVLIVEDMARCGCSSQRCWKCRLSLHSGRRYRDGAGALTERPIDQPVAERCRLAAHERA